MNAQKNKILFALTIMSVCLLLGICIVIYRHPREPKDNDSNMPKTNLKNYKHTNHTISNVPFDKFCVENSLLNREIICKNWLSTEQLEQMKCIDFKVDKYQHRAQDYEPKLLISFKKLPVAHNFVKGHTWPIRTYKNEICKTKKRSNLSSLFNNNFFVKGCSTSNDYNSKNSHPTININDDDNNLFVKIDRKYDEKYQNNIVISTLELEKNTNHIKPVNIIKPNSQNNNVLTVENISEKHLIGNSSGKINSITLAKDEKIKSYKEKNVTKNTGNSIKNNFLIEQDNLTQDIEEDNNIQSHNLQKQENLQKNSKKSKEERIEGKDCLSVCKSKDIKEIACKNIYKNNKIEENYNKTNDKHNSAEDMSHSINAKIESIEDVKNEKTEKFEDREEKFNKNLHKKETAIEEKIKECKENCKEECKEHCKKESKEHCKKESKEEINHRVSEDNENLIQNEIKHMNRADNIVEHNAELHFENKEESLSENEIKKENNNKCKEKSLAEYCQKYQEETFIETQEEIRFKNKEKIKKIRNKKAKKTHKLHIDQCKLSTTKNDEKLIESKNDINNEEDIQKKYSCVCTNEEMKNKLKYYVTVDIIKLYENMQIPFKRFINIYIEQNFYTEIYLDMSENNLETLKPYLEEVIIAVPNCKHMNKYSVYLQHILSDINNHYIIYNEKLFDLGRILILYACLNQNVQEDKDYELNMNYSCTYIGHDIDIYITFFCKQYYDSDQYKNQSENKYKYDFLLPKDACTDIKTEKKPKNKFKKLITKPFRSNKRNKN